MNPVQSRPRLPPPPASPSLSLGDVYYILFRHKWKIILCAIAGVGAAIALYIVHPPPFISEAKLFVRYVVMDSNGVGPPGDASRAMSPDARGETIMQTEVEILTSLDLAKQVAAAVGPEKILASARGDKTNLMRAAALVRRGLSVDLPPNTSVIRIDFRNRDPAVVQPVLQELIDRYFKMHVEIHQAVGIVGSYLSDETEQLRARLDQTESELRTLKTQANVSSIDAAQKMYAQEFAELRQQLLTANAELAERETILQTMGPHVETAAAPSAESAKPILKAAPEASPAQVREYQSVCERIDLLQRQEANMLTQFTGEYPPVKEIRSQLAEALNRRQKLETEQPQLLRHPVITAISSPATAVVAGALNFETESAEVAALQSKIKVLNDEIDKLRSESAKVDQYEAPIQELERKKQIEETNYRYYAASLEQARINEALGNGRISNISTIQSPSPPGPDTTKLFKFMGGLAAGGLAAGLAWAFLIEMFFDSSVRRPKDVELKMKVPLFLSIPNLRANRTRLKTGVNGHGAVAPWEPAHGLRAFHETLRDRLIGFFESRNLTHKPKLIAVSSISRKAGVTTTAAGLARCLSETGTGNVLLVDTTGGARTAQQFSRGKPTRSLDEVLDAHGGPDAKENLYVVSEGSGTDRLSAILPQRFTELMPKLKSGDFDYIIFDMPPISQISITPRLASFMDLVLVVVESEKSDQQLVQRATDLLAESKVHVGVVLNRMQAYVPARLQQDFQDEAAV